MIGRLMNEIYVSNSILIDINENLMGIYPLVGKKTICQI